MKCFRSDEEEAEKRDRRVPMRLPPWGGGTAEMPMVSNSRGGRKEGVCPLMEVRRIVAMGEAVILSDLSICQLHEFLWLLYIFSPPGLSMDYVRS